MNKMIIPIANSNMALFEELTGIKIHIAQTKKGNMIFFGDTSAMEQDNPYMNQISFPNEGKKNIGRGSLWMSMFERQIKMNIEETE